ncbi:hypothetical protein ABIA39_008749 [Nocardia sp. GAS34]
MTNVLLALAVLDILLPHVCALLGLIALLL